MVISKILKYCCMALIFLFVIASLAFVLLLLIDRIQSEGFRLFLDS